MGKLSALGTETTFSLSDFLVKVKAAGAGDVLVTLQNLINAMGAAPSSPYKFYVYRAAAQSPGTPSVLGCDTKVFDTGSNVDVVTNKGRFTAPIAGWYWFNACVSYNLGGGNGLGTSFYKNGSIILQGNAWITATGGPFSNSPMAHGLIQLAANDYVEVSAYGSSQPLVTGATQSYFQGMLWAVS